MCLNSAAEQSLVQAMCQVMLLMAHQTSNIEYQANHRVCTSVQLYDCQIWQDLAQAMTRRCVNCKPCCSLRAVFCTHLPSDREDISPSEPSRLLCPVPSVPFALCTVGGNIVKLGPMS